MNDWLRRGGSYFDVQRETEQLSNGFGETEFPFWREPDHEKLSTRPDFLILRLVKPPVT